jgi:hypothetical protein
MGGGGILHTYARRVGVPTGLRAYSANFTCEICSSLLVEIDGVNFTRLPTRV